MSDAITQDITFSFVSPVYNEQEGLETFYHRLVKVADKLGEPYEIIFVNDGSTDDTAGIIHHLALNDPRIKTVEFSRNFGHQVAVTAGYDYASGRAVITLDADCQHPPELIPDMVARWREGFEIVYTIRQDTAGISRLRRAVGRLAYKVIRHSSGANLTDQADFRLVDRKAVQALRQVREHARFVRGLVNWIGFRQIGIPYSAERRAAGKSNYSFKQLLGMSNAGVYNFSSKPLHLAPTAGVILLLAALMYAGVAIVLSVLGNTPPLALNLSMAMVALFGLNFIFLGVMGEYVSRIFDEAKGRPLYVVRSARGFEQPEDEETESKVRGQAKPQKFVLYT